MGRGPQVDFCPGPPNFSERPWTIVFQDIFKTAVLRVLRNVKHLDFIYSMLVSCYSPSKVNSVHVFS